MLRKLEHRTDREPEPELPPISANVIERLRRIDPNGGRCIITNEPYMSDGDVEVAHLMSRNYAKYDRRLSALEWVWLMQRGSLHVDTRYNICFLKRSLHNLFKKGAWIFLPSVEIVNKYIEDEPIFAEPLELPAPDVGKFVNFYQAKERGSIPELPMDQLYTYELYPLPCDEMRETIIHRYAPQRSKGAEGDKQSVESYSYPFSNFPKITSHIHPRYVILAASRGLDQVMMTIALAAELDRGAAAGRIMKIMNVYQSWKAYSACLPPCARMDPVFMGLGQTDGGKCENNRDQEDENEDDGYDTDVGRLLPTPPLEEDP
ncbi:hypothetical protein CVT24_008539 [Panaeolus cyanescens]|uniref:HNH nuclease domain-containing protein n=1 Tax=Panaeolus cyanescens TaxID=181874 RepID=A0A409VL08_9AGAR|nr:hypothetical protein CVT24_008539 [Panaeolus cyanescens]